jgi:nucleoside-diphosphate-sugar epimerase
MIENYDKCSGQPFNVGLSTANLSKLELAEKIKDHIPNLVIKQDEFKKDFDQRNYIVSNEKIESLGWKPMYDLDYGIKQLIHAYDIVITHNNRSFTNL